MKYARIIVEVEIMINKTNIAHALNRTVEILVALRDIRELVEGECTSSNQADTSITNVQQSVSMAVDSIYTMQKLLGRAINEN